MIKALFGLGNPGENFYKNYHNIGRRILEEISKDWKNLKYSSFSNYNGIILAKSLVFMNDSGLALKEILKNFNLKNDEICLVHDDNDIPFGFLKISFSKKSAGHKGVESVFRELKTKNIWRIRIGIQFKKRKKAEDFILKNLNKNHEKIFNQKIKKNFINIIKLLKEKEISKLNLQKNFLIN